MNGILREKFLLFESQNNANQKFINAISCVESIIMYYSVTFFFHTRLYEYTSQEIVENIISGFCKPVLLSTWNDLLINSISLLNRKGKIKIKAIPESCEKFIETYSALFDDSKLKTSTYNSLLICLNKLRNKTIGHGGVIESRVIGSLENNGFYLMIHDLYTYLSSMDKSKLIQIEAIRFQDDDHFVEYNILSDDFNRAATLNSKYLADEYDNSDNNVLYFLFEEDGNKIISAAPFFIMRDSKFRHYNTFDKSKDCPVYKDFYGQSEIPMKVYKNSFRELISYDIDIKSSVLSAHIKIENGVYHNLPEPAYSEFIGRKTFIDNTLKALAHPKFFLISLSGIGGIGKSALAIKVARMIIDRESQYDTSYSYIIWVSAKKTYLEESGIKVEKQSFETLNQLLDLILRITGFGEGLEFTFAKKKQYCIDIIGLDKFLLVVDNFETVSNPKLFVDFFEEIGEKCPMSKVIITSRRQVGTSEKIIDIQEMEENEYTEYVNYLSNRKFSIPFSISNRMINRLYSFTGGLPLATEFILSKSKKLDDLRKTISRIEEDNIHKDSILDFSYNDSYSVLNDNDKRVLYSITLMSGAKISIITYITQLHEYDVDESLQRLKELSFINETNDKEEVLYTVLPLTRIFVDKTIGDNEAFKNEINARFDEYNNIMRDCGFEEFNIPLTTNTIGSKYAKAAYIQAHNGLFAEAEENFKKAIQISGSDPEVWYIKAIASQFSTILDKSSFEKAISLSTGIVQINYLHEYSNKLFEEKDYDNCIGNLRKLIRLSPNNKSAQHVLGKAYFEKGHIIYNSPAMDREELDRIYRLSINSFTMSFYDTPKSEYEMRHNAVNCFYLARLERYLGDSSKALAYVYKGLKYQPNNNRLIKFMQVLKGNAYSNA